MKTHELKILPKYFEDVSTGIKTFEIRYNDRNFKVKDICIFREFENGKYTGQYLKREIVYILNDFVGLKMDYVGLGLGEI